MYHIYSAIRQVFPFLEWQQIVTEPVLWNFAIKQVLPFLNSPKDLDGSRFFSGLFWKEKTPSYNQRNRVVVKSPVLVGALLLDA